MSLSICGRILTRSFLRKRSDVCNAEMDSSRLERTYTLFDLLCVGIGVISFKESFWSQEYRSRSLIFSHTTMFIPGGTVGSGVFVLTGLIAREYTGPGVVISWLIAGFGCCFSAMSYAELSCRIPSAGSSYAYVYVALGESHSELEQLFGQNSLAIAEFWIFPTEDSKLLRKNTFVFTCDHWITNFHDIWIHHLNY